MNKSYRLVILFLLSVTAGCRVPAPGIASPPQRPTLQEPVERSAVLSIRDALSLTLLYNQELQAFAHDVRAAEARAIQAALRPNPEVGIELSEFDRNGDGMDASESVIGLSQLIELGGKRRWRKTVAARAGDLAAWDYERQRLTVVKRMAQRFTEAIAAERRHQLAQADFQLAVQTSRAVGERVRAGKEPPVQAMKAQAELEMARLAASEADAHLAVSRKRLAAMWGDEKPHFHKVVDNFDQVLETLPSLASLRPHLSSHPNLARGEAVLRMSEAELASAKAARTPDLVAAVGFQNFEEDGSDALAFSLSLPLPLFDRNQGTLAAARHELAKVQAQQESTRTELAAELAGAYATLTSAQQKALVYRSKIIPAFRDAFDAVYGAYGQGKVGFLEVMDAQRSLFASEAALLTALTAYHLAMADMATLTGTDIETLETEKVEN